MQINFRILPFVTAIAMDDGSMKRDPENVTCKCAHLMTGRPGGQRRSVRQRYSHYTMYTETVPGIHAL